MDQNWIQEGDIRKGGGFLKGRGTGRSKDGARVGAEGEGREVAGADCGDSVAGGGEHLWGVLAVGQDGERLLVEGEEAAEGLDKLGSLDLLQVRGDLRLGPGGSHGLGIVEGLALLLKVRLQLRVRRRVRDQPSRAAAAPRRRDARRRRRRRRRWHRRGSNHLPLLPDDSLPDSGRPRSATRKKNLGSAF